MPQYGCFSDVDLSAHASHRLPFVHQVVMPFLEQRLHLTLLNLRQESSSDGAFGQQLSSRAWQNRLI